MATNETTSNTGMSQREVEMLNHIARATVTAREYAQDFAKKGDSTRQQLWLEAAEQLVSPEQWIWECCEFKIHKTGDGGIKSQGLTKSQDDGLFEASGIILGINEIPDDLDSKYLVSVCVRLSIGATLTERELREGVQDSNISTDNDGKEKQDFSDEKNKEAFREWHESLNDDEREWVQGLQTAILIVGGYEALMSQTINDGQFSPQYIMTASSQIMHAQKAWFKIAQGRHQGDTLMQLAHESALELMNSVTISAQRPDITMQELYFICLDEAKNTDTINQIPEQNRKQWQENVAWKVWSELVWLKSIVAPGTNFLREIYQRHFRTPDENFKSLENILEMIYYIRNPETIDPRSYIPEGLIELHNFNSLLIKDTETKDIREVEMLPAPIAKISVEKMAETIYASLVEPLIAQRNKNEKKTNYSIDEPTPATLNNLHSAFKKSFSGCLYPEKCANSRIAKAHSISRGKFLSLLEENGKVIMPKQNPGQFIHSDGRLGYYSPIGEVGWIKQATTFTGLCDQHDHELFSLIDNSLLNWKDPEYLFLIAYRAVLFDLHQHLSLLQKLSASGIEQSNFAAAVMLPRLMHMVNCLKYKQSLDEALLQKNWHIMKHSVIFIPHNGTPPSVAVSKTVSLDDIDLLNPPNMPFTLLPNTEQSVAIFSAINEDEKHMQSYIETHLSASPETLEFKQQLSRFIIQHCNNFVLSPQFWKSLSKETQHKIENYYIRTDQVNDHTCKDPDLNLFYV